MSSAASVFGAGGSPRGVIMIDLRRMRVTRIADEFTSLKWDSALDDMRSSPAQRAPTYFPGLGARRRRAPVDANPRRPLNTSIFRATVS